MSDREDSIMIFETYEAQVTQGWQYSLRESRLHCAVCGERIPESLIDISQGATIPIGITHFERFFEASSSEKWTICLNGPSVEEDS